MASGRATLIHLYRNSCWVSFYIRSADDVPTLIELLKLNNDHLTAHCTYAEVNVTEMNPERTNRTILITILPQASGQYLCQISTDLSDCPTNDTLCYGQTKEHAITIALEQLANHYRQIAEKQQNRDWDAVEQTETGELIAKHYHVILHYERIAEAESKFEAMHDTIMGNTVVENAKITVIEVAADLPIEPLVRFAQED